MPANQKAEANTDGAASGLAVGAGFGFSVIEGTPPVPKDFCVVCGKPNCNTLQHGKWACSEECCEIIIRGETKKQKCN